MLPGSFHLSRRAVPLAASRRGDRPRRSQPVLFLYGVSTGGSPALGGCYPLVRPQPVHYKYWWHADSPDVDIHVSWVATCSHVRPEGSE